MSNGSQPSPYDAGPFRQVADLEAPLMAISDLLRGLCLLAETLEEDKGRVVQRMAMVAESECTAAQELQEKLFRMTHPKNDAEGHL